MSGPNSSMDEARRLADEVHKLAKAAMDEHRPFTAEEDDRVKTLLAKAEQARTRAADAEVWDGFAKLLGGGSKDRPPTDAISKAVLDSLPESGGRKQLIPSGTVTTAVPAPPAVVMGEPVRALLSVIPSSTTDAQVIPYLRQVERDQLAAVVPSGAEKPVSTFGLEPVEVTPRVVATLSEPIDKFVLADSTALASFLDGELRSSVLAALEDEVLNGDNSATHLDGLLNVSGVQSEPFGDSAIATIRRSLTSLDVLGYGASAIVMHPVDWQDLELSLVTSTASAVGGGPALPYQAATRSLFGVPLVTAPSLPVGSAVIGDFRGSSAIVTRGPMQVDWSEALGFSKNQVTWRAEIRAAVEWFRPQAFVVATVNEEPEEAAG